VRNRYLHTMAFPGVFAQKASRTHRSAFSFWLSLHCNSPIGSRAAKIWTAARSSEGLNRGIREIRGKEMASVFPAGFRVFRVFRGYSWRFGCGWPRCALCALCGLKFVYWPSFCFSITGFVSVGSSSTSAPALAGELLKHLIHRTPLLPIRKISIRGK